MNSSYSSFDTMRRAAIAATVVFALSTTAAVAQSSSTSGTRTNDSSTSSSNLPSDTSPTSNPDHQNMSSSESAAKDNANDSNAQDKLSWSDRRFVHKAAKGGMSEVALGQLAAEKANNPDVRSFGQQLVQDHQAANSQLMQIAQSKNVKMDKVEDGKDHEYKRLVKKSGQEFDRDFVDHEVKDHQEDIKEFEKESENAKDPEIRTFAAQTLPKLREHLATAQRLQQSIVPTGHMDNSSGRSGLSGPTSSGSSDQSGHGTNAGTMSGTAGSPNESSGSASGATSSTTSSTR